MQIYRTESKPVRLLWGFKQDIYIYIYIYTYNCRRLGPLRLQTSKKHNNLNMNQWSTEVFFVNVHKGVIDSH